MSDLNRATPIAQKRQQHGEGSVRVGRSREYRAWIAIKHRCLNHRHPNFHLYGGRGITIADEWRNDFVAFRDHIGRAPTPSHQVDRIDNAIGYVPGNVRWATAKEQARNFRKNVWIEHDGRRLIILDWARELGMSVSALRRAYVEQGLSIAEYLVQRAAPRRNAQREKTHCAHGHPFSGDNLLVLASGDSAGKRICRTCGRDNMRRRRTASKHTSPA